MMSAQYQAKYSEFYNHSAFLAKAMAENSGSTANAVAQASGEDGVHALFDVMMDAGHRAILVQALNSPSLTGWVKSHLEIFLYGTNRQQPALFRYMN
jgi:hypothetical protein